jgi:hypothetical protein
MIATPIAVMAQTRLGVRAPWRVVRIIAQICTLNEYLPNHQFHLAEMAETLGFKASASEGFSEPPGLQILVRGISGLVDTEISRGGYGGGTPAIAPASVVYGPVGRAFYKILEIFARVLTAMPPPSWSWGSGQEFFFVRELEGKNKKEAR